MPRPPERLSILRVLAGAIAWEFLRSQARLRSARDSKVLITGETGVGKCARPIHPHLVTARGASIRCRQLRRARRNAPWNRSCSVLLQAGACRAGQRTRGRAAQSATTFNRRARGARRAQKTSALSAISDALKRGPERRRLTAEREGHAESAKSTPRQKTSARDLRPAQRL